MYLEISNIAAVCNKNPYQSRELILLQCWARHCSKEVKEYLIENKCIRTENKEGVNCSTIQKEVYDDIIKRVDKTKFDVKNFDDVTEKVVKKYKIERNNEQSEEEINKLITFTKDNLAKDNGNFQENNLIEKEKYQKGNNKMYYLKIGMGNIGGRYDASKEDEDLLIEIKTRTKKTNVKRNEYDLYQLIGYLITVGKPRGKIVQIFNKEKFDANEPNDKEYGIVELNYSQESKIYIDIVREIEREVEKFFVELNELMKTNNFIYLDKLIPKQKRPIIVIDEKNNEVRYLDNKYQNLYNKLYL